MSKRRASGDLLEVLGIDLWDDPSYVLMDRDCDIYTPVKFGVKQEDIYGKGIRIYPRKEGRLDTEYFRSNYIDSLDPLEDYDMYVVLFSGGKDSTACFLTLLEKFGICRNPHYTGASGEKRFLDPHGVLNKIELWHHCLDKGSNRVMDWKCTENYVKAFADYFGVKLRISYRVGGFYSELYRIGSSMPICWEDPDSGVTFTCKKTRNQIASDEIRNSTILSEEQKIVALKEYGYRHKFPAKTGVGPKGGRWCSSALKMEVSTSVFSNFEGVQGKRILLISGERRAESANRSLYNEMEKDVKSSAPIRYGREVTRWRMVVDYTEKDVWNKFVLWGVEPPAVYKIGWSRFSCCFCIYSNCSHWKGLSELYPEEFQALCKDEEILHFTLDNKRSLPEMIRGATSCVYNDARALWHIKTGQYAADDIETKGTWYYPAGAFHGTEGGPC